MNNTLLSFPVKPDWEGLVRCIRRQGTPARVHFIELFLDAEMQDAVCARFGLLNDLDPATPEFGWRRQMAIQRFLGYDYVRCGVGGLDMPLKRTAVADTAQMARATGRHYVDERTGPITNWAEFEAYPWPNPAACNTQALEWYSRNLPDDMCIIGSGGFAHFAEYLSWLMGYETLCYALTDRRDLVAAIAERLLSIYRPVLTALLQFDRVRIVWGSDDMGFRSATLISPDDLRAFVLPGHTVMARMAHAAGRPYLLHACGNLEQIMPDLIDGVGIDAKHSFEDTIEDVIDTKRKWGHRIALLGGIDVDFLCTADESRIRARVRRTLDACHPGGGYCLGSGNSVTNYIPLQSYLTMLDEGRRWGR
jgi:uroporphyrinogen decarboxylase